ncbi:MAG: hypothetical protein ACO3Y3_12270 [Phycisphaerales bacterium]
MGIASELGSGTGIVSPVQRSALPSASSGGSVGTSEEERTMLAEAMIRLTANQKKMMLLSLLSFLALC